MSECLFQDCYRIPTTRATWHDYNAGEYFITICTQNKKPYFGKIVGGRMIFSKIGQFADEQCRNIQMHHAYATIPLWVVMPNHMHAVVVIDNRKIPYEKRNVELSRRHVETFQETSLQRVNVTGKSETFQETSLQRVNETEKSETFQETSLQRVNETGKSETFQETSLQRVNETGNSETFQETSLQRVKVTEKSETFQETSLQRESIKIATEMQSWLSIVVRQLKQSITRFAKNNNIPFAWQSRFHDHIIRNNDDRNAIAEYIENNVVKWEYDKFYC